MSSVSPSKKEYCSIIGEIVDKTKDVIVDTEEALEYDAVELTILLKSIGFRLNSFEFDTVPVDESNDIEIDIRCKRSGITSKLLLNSMKCTCPSRQAENNNSFWEIQGRAPTAPIAKLKGIIQDTSCNLLPDITRKTANIARTMLTMLLQHYQNDFLPEKEKMKLPDLKQFAEHLNIKKPITDQHLEDSKYCKSPEDQLQTDRNSQCFSTPLSSMNVTPLPTDNGVIANTGPKVILCDTSSSTVILETSENDDNQQKEQQQQGGSNETLNISECKTEILTNGNMDSMIDKLCPDNERDICLIESITKAREELNSALLLLKCNVTRDISESSILMVTPQSIRQDRRLQSKPLKTSKMLSPGKRRMSLDNIDITSTRKSLPGNVTDSKMYNSFKKPQVKGVIGRKSDTPSKNFKGDTPRPPVDLKMTVEKGIKAMAMRRSASGTNLKGGNLNKNQITKSASKLSSISGANSKK